LRPTEQTASDRPQWLRWCGERWRHRTRVPGDRFHGHGAAYRSVL